jgi:hypothetical protein
MILYHLQCYQLIGFDRVLLDTGTDSTKQYDAYAMTHFKLRRFCHTKRIDTEWLKIVTGYKRVIR